MGHRLREQARSHKKQCNTSGSRSGDGSQLKRRTLWERACSRKRFVSHMDTGWATVFAGKPAPTGISLFGILLVFPADKWPLLRNLF